MNDPREQFAATAVDLVDTHPDTAIVYAEIAGQYLGAAQHRHPDRVINVGIREQLMVNVGAGMSLAGIFPIVHTFAPFLVERAYEQIKLGFAHQDTDGMLVSTGGSVDMAAVGRTHQTSADVALMGAVPGFAVHVPGTAAEVDQIIRNGHAARGRSYVRVTAQQNSVSFDVGDGRLHRVRDGSSGLVVIAVGPVLDAVLAATEGLDATVCYTATVRPFDGDGLRAAVGDAVPDVVLVEPYLGGTSAHQVSSALTHRPHRLLSLGFGVDELRHYGTAAQHLSAAGLDAAGLAVSIRSWRMPVAV
ncbi:transketolase [Williamsia sp.]|uniref:transketolase family protein n=1 Tax=Williamsia sp. TaxID=1872085 RepID=UPI001A334EBF|nr:transketolase [Williamsia sp.]MBJ7289029.1 transketolase [Williamsia sp.]